MFLPGGEKRNRWPLFRQTFAASRKESQEHQVKKKTWDSRGGFRQGKKDKTSNSERAFLRISTSVIPIAKRKKNDSIARAQGGSTLGDSCGRLSIVEGGEGKVPSITPRSLLKKKGLGGTTSGISN